MSDTHEIAARVPTRLKKIGEDMYVEEHGLRYLKFLGGQGWTVWRITGVSWTSTLERTHRAGVTSQTGSRCISGHQSIRIAGPFTHLDEAKKATGA